MDTTFKIKASELDMNFLEAIKKLFKDSVINITISSSSDDEAESIYSDDLLKAIDNIEKNKNLVSFSIEEFEDYSNKLIKK